MSNLKIKYGDFSCGGIDMDFYFDDVKIQTFWFSLCVDSFTTITRFLEQFLDYNLPYIIREDEILSENQKIVKSHSVILDGEGADLEIKLEEIQTGVPCAGGTAYTYDTVRLTIKGFENEANYLEEEPVSHEMIGDKKQIISELYFTMMNVLGYEVANKRNGDESCDFRDLQIYNDCKSIIIEEFLYPELKYYYVDKKTKIHLKQQIIRSVKIITAKDLQNNDILKERENYPRDCEIFYLPKEYKSKLSIWINMRMILPIETSLEK